MTITINILNASASPPRSFLRRTRTLVRCVPVFLTLDQSARFPCLGAATEEPCRGSHCHTIIAVVECFARHTPSVLGFNRIRELRASVSSWLCLGVHPPKAWTRHERPFTLPAARNYLPPSPATLHPSRMRLVAALPAGHFFCFHFCRVPPVAHAACLDSIEALVALHLFQ